MQVSDGVSWTRQYKIGRWSNPGRWMKNLCHDKFYKVDSLWFCELCYLTLAVCIVAVCIGLALVFAES